MFIYKEPYKQINRFRQGILRSNVDEADHYQALSAGDVKKKEKAKEKTGKQSLNRDPLIFVFKAKRLARLPVCRAFKMDFHFQHEKRSILKQLTPMLCGFTPT